MTESISRTTAQIIPFPVRRPALSQIEKEAAAGSAFSEAWYHQDAIETDDKRTIKR